MSAIADSENPYLYAASGPKKIKDYGKLDDYDNDNLASYDQDLTPEKQIEGAYSVSVGDKFKLPTKVGFNGLPSK